MNGSRRLCIFTETTANCIKKVLSSQIFHLSVVPSWFSLFLHFLCVFLISCISLGISVTGLAYNLTHREFDSGHWWWSRNILIIYLSFTDNIQGIYSLQYILLLKSTVIPTVLSVFTSCSECSRATSTSCPYADSSLYWMSSIRIVSIVQTSGMLQLDPCRCNR